MGNSYEQDQGFDYFIKKGQIQKLPLPKKQELKRTMKQLFVELFFGYDSSQIPNMNED